MRLVRVFSLVTAALLLSVGVSSCSDSSQKDEGPAELVGFVNLGTSRALADVNPREVTDQTQLDSFADEIQFADADNKEEIAKALAGRSDMANEDADSVRRFAFVEPGCAETTAVMHVTSSEITVELIEEGGETNCDAAVYFLAVFDIKSDDVPPDAQLA